MTYLFESLQAHTRQCRVCLLSSMTASTAHERQKFTKRKEILWQKLFREVDGIQPAVDRLAEELHLPKARFGH